MSTHNSGAGHTPGPWVVVRDGNGCRIEAQNGDVIATVHHPFPFATDDKERDANANVLAAATDLLNCLRSAKTLLVADGYWDQGPIIKIFDAAIARATTDAIGGAK